MLGITLPQPITLWAGLALVIVGVVVALLGQTPQNVPTGRAEQGRA